MKKPFNTKKLHQGSHPRRRPAIYGVRQGQDEAFSVVPGILVIICALVIGHACSDGRVAGPSPVDCDNISGQPCAEPQGD